MADRVAVEGVLPQVGLHHYRAQYQCAWPFRESRTRTEYIACL